MFSVRIFVFLQNIAETPTKTYVITLKSTLRNEKYTKLCEDAC